MKVDINSHSSPLDLIDGQSGYFIAEMTNNELLSIKRLVEDQYYTRILSEQSQQSSVISSMPMNQYHLHSEQVDHQSLWPKKARILGPNAVDTIKTLPFYKTLVDKLGVVEISGEENSGWQEIYWRIVRPGNSDIGELHADKWFWDLGHGVLASNKRRIKIWIALETSAGQSGLRVAPGSHLDPNIKYHGEVDHTGIAKPKLDEAESSLDIMNLVTNPGEFVIFHDELIHGGMVNQSNETRVSIEATLLIPC